VTDLTYEGTLREITTDAGVLRYHEAGPIDSGRPLLLLHGSGPGVTGWRNFRGVLGTFAERFRCLILEFPGFGVSDDFGGHPMITALESVVRFVDALGLETVDIIGNSMGGGVALNFAIAHPDRVRRVVTIGGIGRNILTPAPSEGIRLLQEFTEEPSRERLVRWLHSMVYDPATVTEELIEERLHHATDPQTLAGARRMYSKGSIHSDDEGAGVVQGAAVGGDASGQGADADHLGPRRQGQPIGYGVDPDAHHPQRRVTRVPQLRSLDDDRGERGVRKCGAGVLTADGRPTNQLTQGTPPPSIGAPRSGVGSVLSELVLDW
jgi:pimeloyl-ACP methyl ester carboxylesterase